MKELKYNGISHAEAKEVISSLATKYDFIDPLIMEQIWTVFLADKKDHPGTESIKREINPIKNHLNKAIRLFHNAHPMTQIALHNAIAETLSCTPKDITPNQVMNYLDWCNQVIQQTTPTIPRRPRYTEMDFWKVVGSMYKEHTNTKGFKKTEGSMQTNSEDGEGPLLDAINDISESLNLKGANIYQIDNIFRKFSI